MAIFNRFNAFSEALAEKVHNLGSDTLMLALTSVAPVATNSVLADLTQIAKVNEVEGIRTRKANAIAFGAARFRLQETESIRAQKLNEVASSLLP